MKRTPQFGLALVLTALTAHAQLVVQDTYDVTGSGTGFTPGSGVNSGINLPPTRLTGSAASNLRYYPTFTSKAATAYTITGSKLKVAAAANSGRFVLSADGATSYDFAPALGIAAATPLAPLTYDVTMSMANNSAGVQRFSFALGTADGDAFAWDFGLQLYRAVATDAFYTIQKRIDIGSSGLADINLPITTTAAGTFGNELNFLMRLTDAGAESTAYNSRLQISMDGGNSFFYDTAADSALPSGWRFDGTGRHFIWDVAGQAVATYDNFSVAVTPEPSAVMIGLMGLAVCMAWKRRGN